MDFRGKPNLTRGMRNNNVGNLKPANWTYEGQVGKDEIGHAIFSDMKYGAKAMVNDIAHKFYTRSPRLDTIRKFISVYAPAKDKNNEAEYRNWISKSTGLDVDAVIPKDIAIFKNIIKAVGKMEVSTGQYNSIPKADWDYAYQAILPKYFSRDAIDTAGTTKSNKLFMLIPIAIAAASFFFLAKRKK